MTIIAFGLNYTTAPLEIREKVTIAGEAMPDALQDLSQCKGINEAAILSTCNRTEVYCAMDTSDTSQPIDWFTRYHGMNTTELARYIYTHPDAVAVKHMLRVASGLDSMILGEPQVLGQLKDAYKTAVETGSIGQLLSRLFQHSFMVAKQIRSNTAIGNHPVSVAYAAVRLAQQIFGDLSRQTVLLIGAGEMIELTARHLYESQLHRMIIANRTLERSQRLASEFSAYAITIGDIPQHLEEADIIISSTASQLPILGKGAIETAIQKRKHKPIFIVDIAVPRDVEPEAGELDDVYLYTVDDLKEVIAENMKSRQEAALQAEEIIDTQVSHFMDWLQSLDTVSTIRAIRDQAASIQEESLNNAIRKLRSGGDPEQVIRDIARNITNKLIHSPSVQIRQSDINSRKDLLEAAQKLFNLPANRSSENKEN